MLKYQRLIRCDHESKFQETAGRWLLLTDLLLGVEPEGGSQRDAPPPGDTYQDPPQPSLSILLPIFAPPAAPPPLGGYHHNTDCSLELLQQCGRGRPLPFFRALPPRHSSSLALSVSHRGEGKVGRNPKKKSPTKPAIPSAEDSESGPAVFGQLGSKNKHSHWWVRMNHLSFCCRVVFLSNDKDEDEETERYRFSDFHR